MFGIGRPQVGGDVIAREPLFFTLVLDLAERWRELRELALANQHFLLAGRRIHVPELSVFAGIVALHKRNLGAVGTPLDRFRFASRDPAVSENRFDGELGRRSALGGQRSEQRENSDDAKLRFFHVRLRDVRLADSKWTSIKADPEFARTFATKR